MRSNRNADGGWPYYAGKASRLEPTAWAQLARPDSHGDFATWPSAGGLLLEQRDGLVNYAFNGLALVAMRPLAPKVSTEPLLSGLMQAKGLALPASDINRQDNSLQGWSWVDDTFSWVEPTAWCLLGVKAWRTRAPGGAVEERIREAERMLDDRVCDQGGWNYGNSNMLGTSLHPYVPTTAVALLAMQDRRDLPSVTRSLHWLDAHALSEPSSMALALALIALRVFGYPADHVRAALEAALPAALALGNLASLAAAAYALDAHDDYAAFRT